MVDPDNSAIEDLPADVPATDDPLEDEAEQLAPEPLDVRLAREMPEVDTGEFPAIRQPFFEAGADGGPGDDEPDLFGELEDNLTAEEAAMQVVDEPPGMNYDPDPGYVDHPGDDSGR